MLREELKHDCSAIFPGLLLLTGTLSLKIKKRVDWIFPLAVQLLLLPTSALLYFKMVSFLVPSRVLDVAVLNAKHNEVV